MNGGRRSLRRSSAGFAVLTGAVVLSCGLTVGCEPTESTNHGNSLAGGPAPDLNAPTRTQASRADGGELDAIFEQTQRDAELLLDQQRREGRDLSPDAVALAEQDDPFASNGAGYDRGQGSGAGPARNEIRWSSPSHSRPPLRSPRRDGTMRPTPYSPLFREEQPGIEVKPLEDDETAAARNRTNDVRAAAVDDGSAGATEELATDADHLDQLLVDLRRELYRNSIDEDQPLRHLLTIAATSMVHPDRTIDPEVFRDLTDRERELLQIFQTFFARVGTELDGDTTAEDVLINAILELKKEVAHDPDFKLPSVAMCYRVGGFGDFDVFPRNAFLAHAEQKFVLYVEISGFTSEMNDKNEWVTEVSQQLEIYSDADGIPVWSDPWRRAVDVTTNQRRDFFTTQIITLPKALSVGKYHLKVRVRDEHTGAEAEESIPFDMVADPKRAARIPGN